MENLKTNRCWSDQKNAFIVKYSDFITHSNSMCLCVGQSCLSSAWCYLCLLLEPVVYGSVGWPRPCILWIALQMAAWLTRSAGDAGQYTTRSCPLLLTHTHTHTHTRTHIHTHTYTLTHTHIQTHTHTHTCTLTQAKPSQIGRAHVWTPITCSPLVCRLLLETKQTKNLNE